MNAVIDYNNGLLHILPWAIISTSDDLWFIKVNDFFLITEMLPFK